MGDQWELKTILCKAQKVVAIAVPQGLPSICFTT